MLKNMRQLVDKDSAILGYPNEASAAMNADHQSICKYKDKLDPNYHKVKGVLKSWIAQIMAESESSFAKKSHWAIVYAS